MEIAELIVSMASLQLACATLDARHSIKDKTIRMALGFAILRPVRGPINSMKRKRRSKAILHAKAPQAGNYQISYSAGSFSDADKNVLCRATREPPKAADKRKKITPRSKPHQ